MQVHSLNTPSLPIGHLQTTPTASPTSSTPTNSKEKGITSPVHDPVQLSGHDPELEKLKARDREVRAHEAAHAAAAGSLAKGGPSYTYQRGSDGQLYAVGGEINIDTSAVSGDPEATIQKARQIRAAANAPANPSAQDRAVAAQATRLEAQARRELQQERTEKVQELPSSGSNTPPSEPKIIDLFA
ncbi:putative metalloprotease CJM1_0395 family protein [Candidatus Nitronereus thalassa]|uniref:Metalloprotease CJM1_0395 family protein n=1 Tax=Candidatus Nitronereus thalassa TaxID=3020898 RepID=A0ABU3KBW7_9BACT|nr:putative metalloprotease CJM1_0395 family protein [Candidatus Nitronereus thalassa]MDT7043926.1 putative metalloprotease CJM1_0395 family protein [Candidatus Nitronereus thalassa]